MLLFISAFRTRFSSSLVNFNAQDHQGGWISKYSVTVVVGVAVATFIWRHTWIRRTKNRRIHDLHEVSASEEASTGESSELQCCCGLPAKLRISKTLRNPYRLFYNCPKNVYNHQCEYFHWSDELSASVERTRREISFLRNECIRLHKKIAYVQSRRENDSGLWERERSELREKVTSLQAELDDIKRGVQYLYDLDNMPPVDDSYVMNEENDGAIDIEII
ncbi:uncharacterized protein LOC104904929 isoform X2 [Beta vulgaris subsp. vulgaris]|uniref:uncharacterized protein LOC104904929 isoform X2 n=1 Tax=Beta vulgaris subsp. vulgaris TaxID=3555 RepID=UPI002036E4CC|nr:uncharacterized protein LOC104904929 isoform X2 [Beta vulgaris subsp. vulgaris]